MQASSTLVQVLNSCNSNHHNYIGCVDVLSASKVLHVALRKETRLACVKMLYTYIHLYFKLMNKTCVVMNVCQILL